VKKQAIHFAGPSVEHEIRIDSQTFHFTPGTLVVFLWRSRGEKKFLLAHQRVPFRGHNDGRPRASRPSRLAFASPRSSRRGIPTLRDSDLGCVSRPPRRKNCSDGFTYGESFSTPERPEFSATKNGVTRKAGSRASPRDAAPFLPLHRGTARPAAIFWARERFCSRNSTQVR
jgi:hypothetical protein